MQDSITILNIIELLFADDAVLFATSPEELQIMIDIFNEVCAAYGQEISIAKTQVMVTEVFTKDEELTPPLIITINSMKPCQIIQVVSEFTYVGSVENMYGNMDNEVSLRVSRVHMVFEKFRYPVLLNHNLPMSAKLIFYRNVVLTALTYACEVSNFKSTDYEKFDAIQFSQLKQILGIKDYYVSYVSILSKVNNIIQNEKSKFYPVEGLMRKHMLRYYGHVMRMEDTRIPKLALFSEVISIATNNNTFRKTYSYKTVLQDSLLLFDIEHTKDGWDTICWNNLEWGKLIRKGLHQ